MRTIMNKRLSKKVIAVLTIVMITFSLVACGKKATIVGVWTETSNNSKDEYLFNEDRTGSYTKSSFLPIKFTYTIEGETVSIVMTLLGEDTVKSYNYKIDSNTLTMTIDGQDLTFQKQ